MNSDFYSKISTAVSKERLDAYGQDGVDEATTLGRYLWNAAVCETLYSPLQMVEVALRNSAHRAFSQHYSTDTWYNLAPLTLLGHKQLEEAERNLKKFNKPLTPGHIVSELNFGLWTAFFNKAHLRTGLGAVILKAVGSRCLKSQRRQPFQDQRWDRIRRLRNRIFHYERIIHWKDLPDQHETLLETIGWISPELEEMSRKLDRFAPVYNHGIDPWVAKLRSHWPKNK